MMFPVRDLVRFEEGATEEENRVELNATVRSLILWKDDIIYFINE